MTAYIYFNYNDIYKFKKAKGTIERIYFMKKLGFPKYIKFPYTPFFEYKYPEMSIRSIGKIDYSIDYDINNFFVNAMIKLIENGCHISKNGDVVFDRESNFFLYFDEDLLKKLKYYSYILKVKREELKSKTVYYILDYKNNSFIAGKYLTGCYQARKTRRFNYIDNLVKRLDIWKLSNYGFYIVESNLYNLYKYGLLSWIGYLKKHNTLFWKLLMSFCNSYIQYIKQLYNPHRIFIDSFIVEDKIKDNEFSFKIEDKGETLILDQFSIRVGNKKTEWINSFNLNTQIYDWFERGFKTKDKKLMSSLSMYKRFLFVYDIPTYKYIKNTSEYVRIEKIKYENCNSYINLSEAIDIRNIFKKLSNCLI